MNEQTFTGWFFQYRGNGYGPFSSYDEALKKCHKKDSDPRFHAFFPSKPFYGTVCVDYKKRLIKFERDYLTEHKEKLKI